MTSLQVNSIKADMQINHTSMQKTELRAPFSGTLGLRQISMGAYITPLTVVGTIRQLNSLKLQFTVPEKYGARIKPGLLIHCSTEGQVGEYPATVYATENFITEDTRSLNVKAKMNKTGKGMIAGSFVSISLEMDKNMTAIMIPSQSIIPQARDKKVVAVRNGLASFETVTTGMRDSSKVEITSGLKVGDTVLISGLLSTKPNSPVLIGKIINKN